MRNSISALALAASLATTGCAAFFESVSGPSGPFSGPFGSTPFCAQRPEICILIGVGIVGGVIFILNAGGGGMMHYYVSDSDLKTDLRHVETLENGIQLYAFRYVGDERMFVGVLAEELQSDPRFAHAVTSGEHGYLHVDYGALGLQLAGGEIMLEAGQDAVARALR